MGEYGIRQRAEGSRRRETCTSRKLAVARAASRTVGGWLAPDWRRRRPRGCEEQGITFESRVYAATRPGRRDGGGLRGRRERDAALSCVKLGDRVGRSLIVPASELLSHVHTHTSPHTRTHTHTNTSHVFSLSPFLFISSSVFASRSLFIRREPVQAATDTRAHEQETHTHRTHADTVPKFLSLSRAARYFAVLPFSRRRSTWSSTDRPRLSFLFLPLTLSLSVSFSVLSIYLSTCASVSSPLCRSRNLYKLTCIICLRHWSTWTSPRE